jgi:hypothetical protein
MMYFLRIFSFKNEFSHKLNGSGRHSDWTCVTLCHGDIKSGPHKGGVLCGPDVLYVLCGPDVVWQCVLCGPDLMSP